MRSSQNYRKCSKYSVRGSVFLYIFWVPEGGAFIFNRRYPLNRGFTVPCFDDRKYYGYPAVSKIRSNVSACDLSRILTPMLPVLDACCSSFSWDQREKNKTKKAVRVFNLNGIRAWAPPLYIEHNLNETIHVLFPFTTQIWRISHGCPKIRNFSWSAKNYFWPPMCAANGWTIFLTPGISIIGVHIIYIFISKCFTFNTFRSKHLVLSFLRETSFSMAMTKQWMRKCRRPLL